MFAEASDAPMPVTAATTPIATSRWFRDTFPSMDLVRVAVKLALPSAAHAV
jgi:hypothetical protein